MNSRDRLLTSAALHEPNRLPIELSLLDGDCDLPGMERIASFYEHEADNYHGIWAIDWGFFGLDSVYSEEIIMIFLVNTGASAVPSIFRPAIFMPSPGITIRTSSHSITIGNGATLTTLTNLRASLVRRAPSGLSTRQCTCSRQPE
ncbi:MAG: hypothetical protein ACYC6L_02065 [Anaerolineae bacterium]